MSAIFTIKSNARRAARKAGVDPELVYAVPEGWKFPDPAPTTVNPLSIAPEDLDAAEKLTPEQRSEVFEGAVVAHAVASEFIADLAKSTPKTCPKCSAVFGSCNHTDVLAAMNAGGSPGDVPQFVPSPINTATALVADLDAKAGERVKARKTVKTAIKAQTGVKAAKRGAGQRDGVCNKVIAAIHARWTSIDELLKLSGWQRHTLRGYISTRAAKDGFTVEKRKVEGVPQYRVAA